LDRLADLVPPPRKHRHRYHGVFAPNHPLRPAVTALAIGNIGKRREAAAGGHARDGHGTGGCCDSSHATQKPRSHDTSRLAWAKLMARVGEEFPLECPHCGGDIRLISFITEPGPIRMTALATYEQSVSPETVAEVPLTGLSFFHRRSRPDDGRADRRAAHRDDRGAPAEAGRRATVSRRGSDTRLTAAPPTP
jgi:hypothetical protein